MYKFAHRLQVNLDSKRKMAVPIHKSKNAQPCAQPLMKDLSSLLQYIKSGDETFSAKVVEALRAIILICMKTKRAKDCFREIRGLEFLQHFIYSTNNLSFIEYGFKALACAADQNAANQQALTSIETFCLVQNVLTQLTQSVPLLKSVAFFTSILLYHNAKAQSLMDETGCLDTFITLYELSFPPSMMGHMSVKNKNAGHRIFSLQVWEAINTVLCFAVSDPINESNQDKTSQLIPLALQILQCSAFSEAISTACSFLTSLVTKNARNQNLLAEHDGLAVLKTCLEVCFTSMNMSAEKVENIPEQDLQDVICLIGVIDAAIIDNETSASKAVSVGILTLISRILSINLLDDVSKVKVLLTLAHLIEYSAQNVHYLLKDENLKPFLQSQSLSHNEDILKICKYIIHLMLSQGSAEVVSLRDVASVDTSCTLTHSHRSPSCITEKIAQMRNGDAVESVAESLDKGQKQNEQVAIGTRKKERIEQYFKQLDSEKASIDFFSPEFQEGMIANSNVSSRRLSKSGKRQILARDVHAVTEKLRKQQPETSKPEMNSELSFSGKKRKKPSFLAPIASEKSPKYKLVGKDKNSVTQVENFVFLDKDILSIVKRVCSIDSNSSTKASSQVRCAVDRPSKSRSLVSSPITSCKSVSSRSCESPPSLLDFASPAASHRPHRVSEPCIHLAQPSCRSNPKTLFLNSKSAEIDCDSSVVCYSTGKGSQSKIISKQIAATAMTETLSTRTSSKEEFFSNHVDEEWDTSFDSHAGVSKKPSSNSHGSKELIEITITENEQQPSKRNFPVFTESVDENASPGWIQCPESSLPFKNYAILSAVVPPKKKNVSVQTHMREVSYAIDSPVENCSTCVSQSKVAVEATDEDHLLSCRSSSSYPKCSPPRSEIKLLRFRNVGLQTDSYENGSACYKIKSNQHSSKFNAVLVNNEPHDGQGSCLLSAISSSPCKDSAKKKRSPLKELNGQYFNQSSRFNVPDGNLLLKNCSAKSLKRTAHSNNKCSCSLSSSCFAINDVYETSDEEIDVLNCSFNPVPMAKRLALVIKQEEMTKKQSRKAHCTGRTDSQKGKAPEMKSVSSGTCRQQKTFVSWLRNFL